MTRWLEAARRAEEARTKLTEPTKPHPGKVSSVVSVLSEGERPKEAPPSAMISQISNACANEIIKALRGGLTNDDLDRVMAQYAGAVQAIENMPDPLDAIRAKHIRKLEAIRRTEMNALKQSSFSDALTRE